MGITPTLNRSMAEKRESKARPVTVLRSPTPDSRLPPSQHLRAPKIARKEKKTKTQPRKHHPNKNTPNKKNKRSTTHCCSESTIPSTSPPCPGTGAGAGTTPPRGLNSSVTPQRTSSDLRRCLGFLPLGLQSPPQCSPGYRG